jgi:hypothetical protein
MPKEIRNANAELSAVNRSAEHRLGSLEVTVRELAGTVPGAPFARFIALMRDNGLWRLARNVRVNSRSNPSIRISGIRVSEFEIK